MRLLLILLPVSATFGSLIPGIGPIFGFRILVIIFIFISFIRPANHETTQGSLRTSFKRMAIVWIAVACFGCLFVSDLDLALRDVFAVAFGLLLSTALMRFGLGHRFTLRSLEIGWVVAFLVTAAIAIWELLTGLHLSNFLEAAPDYTREMSIAVASVFGNPNGYGAFLVTASAFLFRGFLSAVAKKWQVAYFLLIMLALFLLIVTGSRLSLAAFVIELLVVAIFAASFHWRIAVAALISLIAGGIAAGSVVGPWLVSRTSSKYLDASPGQLLDEISRSGMSGNVRLNIYLDGLWMIRESAGLGMGPGSFATVLRQGRVPYPTGGVFSPHNLFLEIVSQYGVFVFALFIIWSGACLRLAIRAARRGSQADSTWGVAICAAILGNAISALANSSYLIGSTNWIFLGTVLVGCLMLESEMNRPAALVSVVRESEVPREVFAPAFGESR